MSLNGITGAACCQYQAGDTPGYGVTPDARPVSVGGVQVNVPRSAQGLLAQIGSALDRAIHGGDSLPMQTLLTSAARTYSGGANVIPFPMVNPFKPVIQTGAPVTALTRFPNRFTYSVENTGSEPDDEQSGFGGLEGLGLDSGNPVVGLSGEIDTFGPPPPVPILSATSGGHSTLQSILGTIQGTLPATIEALRANPSNIFPGTSYNPYATNSGGAYPGGTGRAAEDVGAGVGRAADTLGGTFSRFVAEHPYLVIGGGAALVLLFMNPPRRRR